MFTSDDVQKALDEARLFAAEGKYEQALERHIWYHRNALTYAPAHLGVRISFALSNWSDLGKVYPAALLSLREARDYALAVYRKAPSDTLMFSEAMSLCQALDDWSSCKTLYYEGVNQGIAEFSLTADVDQILDLGDVGWAKDVLGDPIKLLQKFSRQREMMRISGEWDSEMLETFDEADSRRIVNLLKAVLKIHGYEVAERVQTKALGFIDNPMVRGALDTQ